MSQKGHEATVTCVKFICDNEVLVSASSDGQIKLWRNTGSALECAQTITQHTKSVTTIATTKGSPVFVSGSADGHLCFWVVDKSGDSGIGATLITDIKLGLLALPLTAALHLLPKSKSEEIVIAVGTTTRAINIYTGTLKKGFQLSTKLEGHGDWIRALAFKELDDGNLMLASGCQDRYIRIWTVQHDLDGLAVEEHDELEDDSQDQLSNIVYQLSTETPYAIKFDALIIGHDDWVYSLRWHPTEIKLMSSSADSSVMVWIPDSTSGVWLCATRLGDISSKGASTATGSYGGVWFSTWIGSENNTIISLTNMGSWKCWKSSGSASDGDELWIPQTGLTGHIQSVTDVAWSPEGQYVLSTCLDKTTRLFAPFNGAWYEVSRPQIHGYEMKCIYPLSSGLFVSGGDEKIMRAFKATKVIANLLNNLLGFTINPESLDSEVAAVPVLSLSNKAMSSAPQPDEEDEDELVGEDYTNHGLDLTKPPLEDQLQRHTLWPETEKIYGHGYEMVTLTCTHDGALLVSTCKANSKDHAVIRTTDVSTWQEASAPLSYHTLTVTRLRFSHDDQFLLSVSRDRTWSVWSRVSKTELTQIAFGKGHSRIIWDCCWLPAVEPTSKTYFFATASRDKTVKIWKSDGDYSQWNSVLSIPTSAPATAIDIKLDLVKEASEYTLAIGLDTGDLVVAKLHIEKGEVILVSDDQVDGQLTPTARINRVAWAEKTGKLAVASDDHSVRIYSRKL